MSHKIAKLAFWLIPILCLSLCSVALMAQTAAHRRTGEKSGEVHAHRDRLSAKG